MYSFTFEIRLVGKKLIYQSPEAFNYLLKNRIIPGHYRLQEIVERHRENQH